MGIKKEIRLPNFQATLSRLLDQIIMSDNNNLEGQVKYKDKDFNISIKEVDFDIKLEEKK